MNTPQSTLILKAFRDGAEAERLVSETNQRLEENIRRFKLVRTTLKQIRETEQNGNRETAAWMRKIVREALEQTTPNTQQHSRSAE
jgi:hypothetical protein